MTDAKHGASFAVLNLMPVPLLLYALQIREQLPREGRSHDVVWLLDAALIQRRLTLPHLRKLAELFTGYLKVGLFACFLLIAKTNDT